MEIMAGDFRNAASKSLKYAKLISSYDLPKFPRLWRWFKLLQDRLTWHSMLALRSRTGLYTIGRMGRCQLAILLNVERNRTNSDTVRRYRNDKWERYTAPNLKVKIGRNKPSDR